MHFSPKFSALLVAATSAGSTVAQQYTLKKSYDASNFLNSFDFMSGPDKWTKGFTNYATQAEAQQGGLAKIVNNKVFLGTDNTTKLDYRGGVGRKSLRLEGKDTFDSGLFVADFAQLPGSTCGMWPAFWFLHDLIKQGDVYSEIDLIESISSSKQNEISLHTSFAGCTMQANPSLGTVSTAKCDDLADGSSGNLRGCGVVAPEGSFGDSFNQRGGGVNALLISADGIKIWNWPTGKVPADVQSGSPQVGSASWGTPVMNFGAGSCDVLKAFSKMKMVIDITFCGSYAGASSWSTYSGCSASTGYATCEQYVAEKPADFTDTHFLINSVKVYQK